PRPSCVTLDKLLYLSNPHCRCQRRSFLRCQGRGLELNPDTCRCRKLRR
ncbi:hypothetical protein DBR06_SOUSAS3710073, partial [Sousa chinensis]